jgi:hypothetical protein
MAPWAHGDVRSLAVEREWDGWDDFFKSGSLMLATVPPPPFDPLVPSVLDSHLHLLDNRVPSFFTSKHGIPCDDLSVDYPCLTVRPTVDCRAGRGSEMPPILAAGDKWPD